MSFTEKKLSRLEESITWSNRQLSRIRDKRIKFIEQFVGYHCFEGGAQTRVFLPLLSLAVLIHARLLAARAPRVLMTTKEVSLKPTAANLELALNQIPNEIGLETTLNKMVVEAMFSIGIVKVGISDGASFVDLTTIDDYFCDMSAKREADLDYEGNDYWMDYEEVMDSDWIMKSAREDLMPDDYSLLREDGKKRAEGIGSDSSSPKPYREKIWLRDVWLPKEKLLITVKVKNNKILREVEREHPERSPYIKLKFIDVPGNIIPLPPSSLWIDLHETTNILFRKLKDGAEAQKTIQGFLGGNDEEIMNLKSAKDGEGIRWSGGDVKKLECGGLSPNTMAFDMQCRDLFSYFAGNLDSLGGLGIQAQTVGQEKMLGEAANTQLRDMSDRVVSVAKEIFRLLAYYEWTDPLKTRVLEKQIPGLDMKLPIEWNHSSKKGTLDIYDLNIDVYSMQDDSPQIRLQKLMAFIDNVVLKLAPLIEAQGGTVDIKKLIMSAAKYSGLQENEELVTWIDEAVNRGGDKPPMPANTTRTYERVGRPGPTQQGASRMIQQALMGSNPGGNSQESA